MNEELKRARTGESGNTQETVEQLRRRVTALWVAVVALALVLGSLAGYGYLTLEKHNLQLSQLPGVQETVAALGQRLEAAEGKLRAWAADWSALEARLDKLDRKVAYNRQLARTEAQKLATQVEERLRADLDDASRAADARLNLLESGQEAGRARLEQVREEVAAVRQETGHDLSALQQQMAESESRVADLARLHEPARVDFELAKDRTRELAPGISLRITGTNVSHQRASGWMWLLPDRKTLWVRELGIQQPFTFYRKDGGGPAELVITTVTPGSVAGYLLLPAGQGFDASPAADAGATAAPAAGLSQ